MLNKTEAARRAYRRMDQAFLALQAARAKMEAARAAEGAVDYDLYAEWEEACGAFRRAHEEWRERAWFPAKPPTEPVINLPALDLSTISADLGV